MDCHLVQEKVESRVIATQYVSTRAQIADMFTKPFSKTMLDFPCNKLILYNIYVMVWGGVLCKDLG